MGDSDVAHVTAGWMHNDVLKASHCLNTFISALSVADRITSTTPGAEPPRDAKDSGSARSHSTHLETSSSDRP